MNSLRALGLIGVLAAAVGGAGARADDAASRASSLFSEVALIDSQGLSEARARGRTSDIGRPDLDRRLAVILWDEAGKKTRAPQPVPQQIGVQSTISASRAR